MLHTGYYRLGQSYPRTRLRNYYPPKKRYRPATGIIASIDRLLLQELTFTQTISRAGSIYNRSISQTLTFNQQVNRVAVKSLSQTLTINQTITNIKVANRSLSQSLTINQDALGASWVFGVLSQTLTINQSLTALRVRLRSVSTPLTINQSVTRGSSIFNRSIQHSLTFGNDRRVYFGTYLVVLPGITGTVAKSCFLLKSRTTTVALPLPIFGDTQKRKDQFNLKRSMNGTIYTYVKTNDRQDLSYTFRLDRIKGLELRNFLMIHHSDIIELFNWKGETWIGRLTNNPIDLIAASRFDPCGEETRVTLDFEGIKIS